MPSTLRSPVVAGLLDRLLAQAAREDPRVEGQVHAREAELGSRLTQQQRYEIYGEAPLAIAREVGELLYILVLGRRACRVVEFGSSLGISTIFLAAAIHDTDNAGSVITSELRPDKAKTALSHLSEAGFGHLVDLRLGDALKTLADIEGPIDLLFLDGRNDLYLVLLRLLEPRLAAGALIVADLNSEDPDLLPYLEYVRGVESGYQSIEIPLGDGVELSVLISS